MTGPHDEIVGYLRADVRRAVERDEAHVTVVTAEAALALAEVDRLTAERDAARVRGDQWMDCALVDEQVDEWADDDAPEPPPSALYVLAAACRALVED